MRIELDEASKKYLESLPQIHTVKAGTRVKPVFKTILPNENRITLYTQGEVIIDSHEDLTDPTHSKITHAHIEPGGENFKFDGNIRVIIDK